MNDIVSISKNQYLGPNKPSDEVRPDYFMEIFNTPAAIFRFFNIFIRMYVCRYVCLYVWIWFYFSFYLFMLVLCNKEFTQSIFLIIRMLVMYVQYVCIYVCMCVCILSMYVLPLDLYPDLGRSSLVAAQALRLIQQWGRAFASKRQTLPLFYDIYHNLKSRGHLDTHTYILSPSRWQPMYVCRSGLSQGRGSSSDHIRRRQANGTVRNLLQYIHAYSTTYIHTYIHTYILYTHTYIHTILHTYIHTYIHTYMHVI